MTPLDELRKEIDEINTALLDLFARRLDVVRKIAQVKKQEGLPLFDGVREKSEFKKISEMAELRGLSPRIMQEVFTLFIEYSRMMMKMEMEKND